MKEEIQWRDNVISSQRDLASRNHKEIESLKSAKHQSPKAAIKKDTPPKFTHKESSHQYVEKLELEKHIRELEARCAELNRQNESLQAEVDEADHYCYQKGSIKTELEELRREKISSLVTINKLSAENHGLKMQLSHAEDTIKGLRMSKQGKKKQEIRFTKDALTQANIDGLYAKAEQAHFERIQPQNARK